MDGYSRALRHITHHLDKSPDTLTTNDLKRYFAQLIKTHSWSIVRIDCSGLRKLWCPMLFAYSSKEFTAYYPSSRKRSMSYP
ncbi:hypothetical protein [Photobacterium sp. S4TG1]|uniref:hypothetical protein n=1 Tax=Photobacterium sp. S4TG1 TaxID=3114587 RepID=UPI003FA6D72B